MKHDPELIDAVVLAIQDACDNYIDGPTEAKAAITALRAYDAANARQDDRRFTAACAAMQGLICKGTMGSHNITSSAVNIADALIAALDKPHDA